MRFVGRFGNDAHASVLETELRENGVDVSSCGHVDDLPSGQGFVMLSPRRRRVLRRHRRREHRVAERRANAS